MFLVALPIIALTALTVYAFVRGSNSAREDSIDTFDTSSVTLPTSVTESIGWPYYFGRGSPSTQWANGRLGVDCSGYAQMVLVKLGLLSNNAADRGATALANDSDPIATGKQRVGDIAIYPGHVMIVASAPIDGGHSYVIGASGGGKTTLGNDVNARVKLFSSALYRGDFVTYGRLRK